MSELVDDLLELGRIGGDPTGVTRLAWSAALEGAIEWCAERMARAGLEVERDAAGNLIGRWGSGAGPAVLVGSHLDTVPCGGRYDGALGVIAGIDAIRRLTRDGFTPAKPIWVAAFMDEEGARFATPLLGSRAFAGEPLHGLDDRTDADGISLASAMRACGTHLSALPAARAIDGIGAYLELHIEQGPRLECSGADVGVVTAVTGMLGLRIRLRGAARHAGTTPMNARSDALVGAARLVTGLRDRARGRPDVVGTVGAISAHPGAPNVVPGGAMLSVDLRSADPAALAGEEAFLVEMVERVAREERLSAGVEETLRQPPVQMDPDLVRLLEASAARVGASALRMPSGAGHDAMVIGQHAPAGMLFVPSVGGISHAPEEFTDARACERGAAVLADALRSLTSSGIAR